MKIFVGFSTNVVNKASLKINKEVLQFIRKIESLVGNEEVPFE